MRHYVIIIKLVNDRDHNKQRRENPEINIKHKLMK